MNVKISRTILVGCILGCSSIVANAGQDPKEFGGFMAKCTAINYLAVNLAEQSGASKKLIGNFQDAFLKTSAMGKKYIEPSVFEARFKQEYDKSLQKLNNGTGKVDANKALEDLFTESQVCEGLRASVENGSIPVNNPKDTQSNSKEDLKSKASIERDVVDNLKNWMEYNKSNMGGAITAETVRNYGARGLENMKTSYKNFLGEMNELSSPENIKIYKSMLTKLEADINLYQSYLNKSGNKSK